MKTRPDALPRAWLLGLLLATLPAAAADHIRGKVVDTGLPETGNGIAGVWISMMEVPGQKPVGQGLTGADGHYDVEIQAPPDSRIVASFSKLGYFARPTQRPVINREGEQPLVRLLREGAPNAYYRDVAQYISADPQARSAYFPAVTALPARDKATVLNTLKLKDGKAYEDFAAADRAYQSTQDLFRKFGASSNSTTGFQAVLTYPAPGTAGTLWLFGSVPSASDRNALERMARTVNGVAKVQNDVKIVK